MRPYFIDIPTLKLILKKSSFFRHCGIGRKEGCTLTEVVHQAVHLELTGMNFEKWESILWNEEAIDMNEKNGGE